MQLRQQLRRVTLAAGFTLLGTFAVGLSATPAMAATTPLPYCVTASDTLGNVGELCVNSISATPIGGGLVGEVVTAAGSIKICTVATACVTRPITLLNTGAGLNSADAVPSIVAGPPITYTITSPVTVCVGKTCTGSVTITLPTYTVTLFPSPPLATVCVNGPCSSTPLAPVTVTNDLGTMIAAISTN